MWSTTVPEGLDWRQVRRLPPERLQEFVRTDEGLRALPADLLRHARVKLEALRRDLEARTCSQA